eukprot:gene4510-7888_t
MQSFNFTTSEEVEYFRKIKLERVKKLSGILKLSLEDSLKKFQNTPEEVKVLSVNNYIDHTVLKSTTTKQDVEKLCKEAIEHKFKAVCVNLSRVEECKKHLKDSSIKIAVVAGFPLGATDTSIKSYETKKAVEMGVNEVDMVLNVGKFLDEDFEYIYSDIKSLSDICHEHNVILKVIIETSLLIDESKILDASILTVLADADFVKTSTGFFGGADKKLTKLMVETVKDTKVSVKVSGGVKNYADAMEYIKMGVKRIGTSSGVQIIKNEQVKSDY